MKSCKLLPLLPFRPIPGVDLEIFRGGFSFTKTPAKLEVKTKKNGGGGGVFPIFWVFFY